MAQPGPVCLLEELIVQSAEEFLKVKELFRLGELPTESPNPRTRELSQLANGHLEKAIETMREVDVSALRHILALKEICRPLFDEVSRTLNEGSKIYLVGCGATGRLSLSLEYLWRKAHPQSNQVVSLMAGGDVALVHSLEGFEDYPEFGARHLRELGFSENDLLIAVTEGGETPYVIGATEEAAKISRRTPFFLYCNDKEILSNLVERSRRILENPKVRSVCLAVGPMALTGSTRMQASTVLMLIVGLALEFGRDIETAFSRMRSWVQGYSELNLDRLASFIEMESEIYKLGGHTIYSAEEFAMTVFTDTTERAPTFNLPAFDNPKFPSEMHSFTYVSIESAASSIEAWFKLLGREPRPLEWPEVHKKATREYLSSFDFGRGAIEFRKNLVPGSAHHIFSIQENDEGFEFSFRDRVHRFVCADELPLFRHLTLKMILNIHSTLVMGRMNRFEGNLMTWVYPSNGKLVDRAARYSQILLQKRGSDKFSYDEIVKAQFAVKPHLSPKESIVHKTMDYLMKLPHLPALED